MYLPTISYAVQYEDYCLTMYAVYRHIRLCYDLCCLQAHNAEFSSESLHEIHWLSVIL